MSELIDERQSWAALDQGIEVHLFETTALVTDGTQRNDLETIEQRIGLHAAMCLDHARNDIDALLQTRARFLQHFVGLANAWGSAEEDLQPPSRTLFPSCQGKQRIG